MDRDDDATLIAHDALIRGLRARVQAAPRRARGKGDEPEAHPRVTAEQVALVESQLGFGLPHLLRRIFEEVADGGFGPAYGIFPTQAGYSEAGQDETIVEVRTKLARDSQWPARLLPLCDWGCASWSCLDCRADDGAVVTLAEELGFFHTGLGLHSWLKAWLAGADLWSQMFEPGPIRIGINPFTKETIEIKGRGKPRGSRWP
jgi:hypothetical protein